MILIKPIKTSTCVGYAIMCKTEFGSEQRDLPRDKRERGISNVKSYVYK